MTSAQPRIEVLLATYNGEQHLAEQVDSILQQDYPAVSILARDDGSSDRTASLLQHYAVEWPDQIRIASGSGVSSGGGAKTNFQELMKQSTAEFVAFSDQDDVWLPGKLTYSMDVMQMLIAKHGAETPLLVFSDLRVVNENLSTRDPSFWAQQGIQAERIYTLHYLLPQNVVTGCTMLCNRALIRSSLPMPLKAFMHDRWMALVASIFGHSRVVQEPTVLYRQHGGNVVGAGVRRNGLPHLFDDTSRRGQWLVTEAMAEALLEHFDNTLPQWAKRVCENFVHVRDHRTGVGRAYAMLRGHFLTTGLRNNLDILWYLLRSGSRRIQT